MRPSFSPVQTLPDSRNSCSESCLEKLEFWAHCGCLNRELRHAGDFSTVSSHSCQVLVSCARPKAVTSNKTSMPAGSLVSPKLGCGAGGACPVPEGGSRVWPSLAALGPSPVMVWSQGPQKNGALTCWVLCTGLCWEFSSALTCCCGQLCHKHQLGETASWRNEGKRGEKEKSKRTWCSDSCEPTFLGVV